MPQGKPNILFISIDTLRADHVSIYNEIEKETSPNIDRIAQKGYVFKRAYTPSSWTLPAHASMMTGLFPSSHQADRSLHQTMSWPVDPLPYSALTLAEILRDNGYRTAGIISNPFVSSTFGMHQGFEFFDDQVDLFEDIRYLSLKDYSILFKILEIFNIIDKDDYDGEQRVIEVNKRALDWFQKHRDDSAPFFLFLHYNEPHFTYEPPWPYNKSKSGMQLDYFTDIELLNEGQFSLSSYGLNDLTALYDGEISYLDHHLGIFFKKLKQWNLLDNTLVIITSDHGESFNEHEIWQHGNSLYEEQIRVPLIIQHPKLVPSSIFDNDNIAQLVDLMPTILDILQIQIPAHIQGRSLLPIFQGKPELSFNLAFAEIRADINWKAQNPRYGDAIKAVLNKEWKYISYDNGREELYNLELDPQEKNNLFSAEIIKAKEMRELLNAWSHAVSPEKRDKKGKIDGGRLEQLRSLGYLQ
ncbi:MAG: sulfatase [Thermodesulfobacteriota bacterium]|nr:sulfatase [Thermodesulfobacteriota bacterium]